MSEDGLDCHADPVELGGREEVVDGEVFHQRVVGVDGVNGLFSVGIVTSKLGCGLDLT